MVLESPRIFLLASVGTLMTTNRIRTDLCGTTSGLLDQFHTHSVPAASHSSCHTHTPTGYTHSSTSKPIPTDKCIWG